MEKDGEAGHVRGNRPGPNGNEIRDSHPQKTDRRPKSGKRGERTWNSLSKEDLNIKQEDEEKSRGNRETTLQIEFDHVFITSNKTTERVPWRKHKANLTDAPLREAWAES